MGKIAFLLAEGFEETEAVVPVDVLRRLEFDVVLVGVDSGTVAGAHGVRIVADCRLSEVKASMLDAVVLPGGMPGSENLRKNPAVLELVRAVSKAGGVCAAICAAPIVLKAAGVIEGKRVTAYPAPFVKEALTGCTNTGGRAEVDGKIVTGKGPGASFEFAVKLAAALGKEAEARQLMNVMFVNQK